MSEKILFNKVFSCDDVTEINDFLIIFSPTLGKPRVVGEELDTPILLRKGKVINFNLKVSVET